ncbi:Abnormal spindle-like microcephaly-associated protein, ASH domain [Phytophthora cactorum]|nr:Abnormal spindle-like microcephaly-associated protein, ASH domain [Phytophthora cactorum]
MYATPSMFRTPSLSSNARSAGISCGTDFMVRKSSDMRGVNDASRAHSKWASRASFDPFNSAQSDASDAQNCHETTALLSDQDSDGKENRVPPIGRNWGHPNVTMRRGSRYSLLEAELLPSTPNFERSTASSLLGKRPATNKSLNASTETKEDDSDAERAQRNPLAAANAVTHFEARALALHAESLGLEVENIGTGSATMLVDDFSHIGQLVSALCHWKQTVDTRERQRARQCQSQVRRIRMNRSGEESAHKKTRFKCDLHVCVVDALKSVTLRVTFDPLPTDVGKEVTAMLKFTVNDRFKLQCRATGSVTPRVPRESRLSRFGKAKAPVDTVVVAQQRRPPRIPEASTRHASGSTALTISSVHTQNEREPEQEPVVRPKVGDKRLSSVAIEFSPPRNGPKRRKNVPPRALTARKSGSPSKRSFAGSWWKQRQEVYDDNWMAKQTQGFTKWINYVLLDGTAQRLGGHDAQDNDEGQTIGVKRRFDFSSLRVLAQKRMESKWAQAAVDLYHSPSMDDILFNLQDEIGNKGFCSARTVHLLNNYHPVWLCLGLYAVLGNQVMRQEKCSLRAIFRTTARVPSSGKKDDALTDRKMPQVLRRIILKHLVKDSHVAQNYRLVKNLMTPMDGSTADRNDGGNAFTNTKKNINGREYFDSLTQSFMLKFFMLVVFLDRAVERKADKFAHFPCLFRIAPSTKKTTPATLKALTRAAIMTNCGLFLASEGRIDKHLKHLGYALKHEQTPLDEIDLEVKNLETDLRDGVRLAKLMEALTTAPVPAPTEQDGEIISHLKACRRSCKVHNVEICLHFLRDKCGASVLDNLKSNNSRGDKKSGRVRVSSCGFAGLRSKVDEKMVGNLAKDIVNGHREKTLALLWKLISCFQLQSLVDAQTMRREIDNVAKRMSFSAKDFFDNQQQSEPLIHTDEHECYTLLLEWCRAVCATTTSQYATSRDHLLTARHFATFSTTTIPCYWRNRTCCPQPATGSADERENASEQRTAALCRHQRSHQAAWRDPVLMPQQYNTKNPPEDKMVVTFVCYLQSRLMDSYSEIHAASRLKRWWKSPLIRLKMHRKKSRSARVVQRFWYTSSHKRLAIRQCRRLLGAAHLVKSTKAFRAAPESCGCNPAGIRTSYIDNIRSNGDSLGAVLVVQYHWRKRLRWRREKERQKQKAMRHKVAQRVRVRASCAVIERNWLQYLSREGARLLRQQMITDRHVAATRIQVAWRRGRCRVVARKQRQQMWRRMNRSAGTIQRTWSAFRRCREETQRVLALQRFELMMKEKEIQKRQLKLKNKVETRAVKCVQKCFRKFTLRKREVAATKLASAFRGKKQKLKFQKEKHAALVLQRNVRMWRRRRQLSALTQFHDMLKSYQRMKATEAQRRVMRLQELKHMVETRAAYRIQTLFRRYRFQKRTLAAVTIQSLVRAWTVKNWYSTLCRSACLLQRNLRIWRRQTQLRGLLSFQKMLLRYRRMQREEEEQQEHIRQHRLRRLQESVEHRAANRIQSVYRVYAYHKRMLAATRIQAAFRGFMKRQQYAKTYASVVLIQRAVRSWLVVTRFRRALRLHRAAVSIQKLARGWSSRRLRLNFYTLQTQLQRLRVLMSCWQIEFWYAKHTMMYRRKRMMLVCAHWTRLSAGLLRKRIADANRIATSWRAFCLRSVINKRIQHKRRMDAAAQRMQVWWWACAASGRNDSDELKRSASARWRRWHWPWLRRVQSALLARGCVRSAQASGVVAGNVGSFTSQHSRNHSAAEEIIDDEAGWTADVC